MKEWLALYKYRGNESLEPVLAAMLAFAFERLLTEAGKGEGPSFFNAITSVPLAPERLRDRGFNQAEKLALRLAGWYGVRYLPMLARLRNTEKQSLKDRRGRVADMKGNFAAISSAAEVRDVRPARIVLIDDIYTTGSTVDECARVLRASRDAEEEKPAVYGILWARS